MRFTSKTFTAFKWRRGGRRPRRANAVRLNARAGASRGGGPRAARLSLAGLLLLVVAGTGALLWFGVAAVGKALFSGNNIYVIKNLDIKGGIMITESLVREYTRIRNGMNLFDLNIDQVREDFLARAPSVKSMQISRILPDTLSIEISERMPLARLGWSGPLVVDRQGVVFVFKGQSSHLSHIIGYNGDGLRPGAQLQGLAVAALEVLDLCDDHPALGLEIEAIEVDNGERLTLRLSDKKSARLSWPEMGAMSGASREQLLKKLGMLSRTLRSEDGMRLSVFDVTLEGRIYGH